jgi:hypothetical protein
VTAGAGEEASARADRLMAAGLAADDLASVTDAVAEYADAMALAAVGSWKRAEIEHNLGAALCLLAQQAADAARAMTLLETAESHLRSALAIRTRVAAARAWALTQANLALVHLTRFRRAGDAVEVMAASIAIDAALDVFQRSSDGHWIDWARDIRTHLLALKSERDGL